MNKYRKLLNNSIIFTVGSFGSRLISFLMVPLYTHLLSTNEYGIVDLLNTTVNLLLPLLTLELGQAALRFSIELKDDIKRNAIFSNISVHIFIVTVLVIIAYPIIVYYGLFENLEVMFLLLLILNIMNNIYARYIRGIGMIKEFALNGILMTLATVISNIILLVFLNLKVEGYILSLIIATLISNIYLFYVSDGISRIKNFNPDFKLLKDMIEYSVPLIPNSAMWWIVNSSSRYFILHFIGAAGNGIYAVANKIPAIISMLTGIFSQAWQISSFEEYKSETKDEFYSKTFNVYWVFLFLAGSALIVILKPLLFLTVEESFYISWQSSSLLILAVIYQSFATFLGTNYSAAKETRGTFSTSVYAGIISIISNFIFVPLFGIMGAALSSTVSFFAMFIIRLYDTRRFVQIKINKSDFLLTNILFIIQIIVLFTFNGWLLYAIELFLLIGMIFINKSVFLKLLKTMLEILKKK